jgi:hypothetical protein
MEVAMELPEDVAAAVPWEDVPRHSVEQIALKGYQGGCLSEEQVRRLLGYETQLELYEDNHYVYGELLVMSSQEIKALAEEGMI